MPQPPTELPSAGRNLRVWGLVLRAVRYSSPGGALHNSSGRMDCDVDSRVALPVFRRKTLRSLGREQSDHSNMALGGK